VTVVLTLIVRDEEEMLAANIDYHLAAGVDLVLVVDHRSEDRTPEILDAYRSEGVVRVFREEEHFVRQHEWQTRLVHLAHSEHAADWVLLGDTDEFWWPRGGSVPEALAGVPHEYGCALAHQLNFVPLQDAGGDFAEQMIVRLSPPAPINDPATPFRPVAKTAVRPGPEVTVSKGGGHQVFGIRGRPLDAWQPLEILHFPLRTREQCARKYAKTRSGWQSNLRGDLARAQQGADADRADAMWDRLALDRTTVERGIADGSLAIDTRLRDALRTGGSAVTRPAASSPDADRRAALTFAEAELVRRQRWLDDLEGRSRALDDRRLARRLESR
jgi:hypothetical protein